MFTGTITTKSLATQLDNPEFIIVDVRPSAAYNGWRLRDEARGGHIRGAVGFSLSWINDLSHADLNALLTSKGILPEKRIVLYGYNGDDFSKLTTLLQGLGFQDVSVYEAGIQAWAADPGLPMERLENFEKLVHPDWVKQFKAREKAGLFEVNFGDFEAYKAGHIPGAIHLDLGALECAPSWNVCSNDELRKFLIAQGIRYNSPVVLYGRNTMTAARATNILMYAGVEDVRILDGGLDAWLRAGYSLERGVRQATPVENFGREIPGRPNYIIDIARVKELLKDPQGALVCVRSWDEYIGNTSGYDYIQAKGRIAGSVWGHSGSDPHHMEDYRNPDDTMRSQHEIEAMWQQAGITADKNIAFYCGSGWRASETFFYAHLMGMQNVAVYDGGWLEWSKDEGNPILQGLP